MAGKPRTFPDWSEWQTVHLKSYALRVEGEDVPETKFKRRDPHQIKAIDVHSPGLCTLSGSLPWTLAEMLSCQ